VQIRVLVLIIVIITAMVAGPSAFNKNLVWVLLDITITVHATFDVSFMRKHFSRPKMWTERDRFRPLCTTLQRSSLCHNKLI